MEPFKNLLNAPLVKAAGRRLHATWPGFDRRVFERIALADLDALEMKARAMRIADALEAALPPSFDTACGVIEAALAPPIELEGDSGERNLARDGLAGWIVWPLGEFVARRGLDEPERALNALHALTQRLTAEFAIRPFIVRHPELTLSTLLHWAGDPSAHVRRLASEGSRPRLPWGLRLQSLIADPTPTLPILAALQDDASKYVRRSVANHLNDIAKDHPALVVDWVKRHLPDAHAQRRALLSHASRTLIKRGHAPMLALWGAGRAFEGSCRLSITPRRIVLGNSVTLTLTLHSTARRKTQTLLIDYAVHHVKANGSTSPKVFKGWKLALAPREARTLTKQHSFKPVTTRRYLPGRHPVTVSINGAVVAEAALSLARTDAAPRRTSDRARSPPRAPGRRPARPGTSGTG
jgi:3-methyladenine DNA glycosylase AlkC